MDGGHRAARGEQVIAQVLCLRKSRGVEDRRERFRGYLPYLRVKLIGRKLSVQDVRRS